MKLNELKIGEEAIIKKVDAKDNIRKRLLDIGMVKGAQITPILSSPSSNMIAYQIKGTVIAIRKDDTENITVEVKQ